MSTGWRIDLSAICRKPTREPTITIAQSSRDLPNKLFKNALDQRIPLAPSLVDMVLDQPNDVLSVFRPMRIVGRAFEVATGNGLDQLRKQDG